MSSNLPFPSRVKKHKKDDEDKRILLIFKQIRINLSFLEGMIHMPKGAKVLKDLLSHKEKLEKAASSVKLSEVCSAIIQRRLPQNEGDPGSFTLPCLIGPLAVKNALADLRASINHMPHSLFGQLGISKLKPTRMSIQLADRSIKYPIGVCENLLVKVSKFIFPVDFVVLEMDEDELVPIILGRPILATARAVIDVHEGKLSLTVRSETVAFNIGKYMKSKNSPGCSKKGGMTYSEEMRKHAQSSKGRTRDGAGHDFCFLDGLSRMNRSYSTNVLIESYEGASPEMRQHKSFGNVTADHLEDIMVSPLLQERFGISKALISDRGTHFCNYQIEKAMKSVSSDLTINCSCRKFSLKQEEFFTDAGDGVGLTADDVIFDEKKLGSS
ncbi:reverse transcriptase domain-containing protein [Tanacetum coccineum]